MMKVMVRVVFLARFVVAVFNGGLLLACSEADAEPPDDPEPGPSTGSTCPSEPPTYANFGMAFLDTYCTRCHSSELTGSGRHGAPTGYDWDMIETVREYAAVIDKMAASGPVATNMTMPPGDPRPTLEERARLGEWLACGAP